MCSKNAQCSGRALLGVSGAQKALTPTRGLAKFLLIVNKQTNKKQPHTFGNSANSSWF